MARPIKGEEPLTQRHHLLLTESEVASIDDWMFANRVRTRSEAIRQLIALGLEAQASPESKPKRKRS